MKRNIEKRFEQLEKALLPEKPKVIYELDPCFLPKLQIVTNYKDADGNLTDENGRPLPVMIMPRPKDTGQDTITITIVDTVVRGAKGKGGAALARPDPEPDDADLETEIEELEARKAALKGRP